MRYNRTRGFTLLELMIAASIIGILTAIALPAYKQHLTRTHRVDAQGALASFANAMERYYSANNSYRGAAALGADTGAPDATTYPSTQTPLDGTPYYNLRIMAATATSYTLRAIPISTQSQATDGYLEILSSGAHRWDKNNDGDTSDADENHW